MIIWEGYCNIYDMFIVKDVVEMRVKYLSVEFVVYLECCFEVVEMGDFVGSMIVIFEYCKNFLVKEFIVGMEDGIGY